MISAFEHDGQGAQAGAVYLLQGPLEGVIDPETDRLRIDGVVDQAMLGGDLAVGPLARASGEEGNCADLVIGAPALGSETGVGRVYILSPGCKGAEPPATTASAWTLIEAEGKGSAMGRSVLARPDLTGDGNNDLIFGIPDHAGTRGRVLVIDAVPEGTTTGADAAALATLRLGGDQLGGNTGRAVSSAGDMDGDGCADLWVGAPGIGVAGAVDLVLGCPTTPGEVGQVARVLGTDEASPIGSSLSGSADLDGDDRPDLAVVGCGDCAAGSSDEGLSTWVFLGLAASATFDLEDATVRLAPTVGRDGSGAAVLLANDRSGDGLDELVIGAPRWSGDEGATWVIWGWGAE